MLFVGNTYDAATNYRSAVKAAGLAPRGVLLSSTSWGHTAYGTSDCVTGAVDRYLLTGRTPRAGLCCTGDYQPFGAGSRAKDATDSTVVQKLVARSLRQQQRLHRAH